GRYDRKVELVMEFICVWKVDRSQHKKRFMPSVLDKARYLAALPGVVDVIDRRDVFLLARGVFRCRGEEKIRADLLRVEHRPCNVAYWLPIVCQTIDLED